MMYKDHWKCRLGALLVALFMGHAAAIAAEQSARSKTVDGMTVHLGLVSAERLMDHRQLLPKGHPVPSAKDMYHVLVAIFDNATGERITDAKVEATVSPLGLAGRTKSLNAATPAGNVTYCNFFKLSRGDTHVIQVEIRRLGIPTVRTAKFTLEHFSG